MVLAILQWREYGADEDCLSAALLESEADDALGFGCEPARRLARREAKVHGLVYAEPEEDRSEAPGDLMWINSLSWTDGAEIGTEDGRRFKIRFEEVK